MRLRLGAEDDERLARVLKAVLDELGAELTGEDFWVVGAIEINRCHLRVGKRRLKVVGESHSGLFIHGGGELVRQVAERVRAAYVSVV